MIYIKGSHVTLFLGASQNCEERLLVSSCLSVRMEQFSSQWKDFHEIWNVFSE